MKEEGEDVEDGERCMDGRERRTKGPRRRREQEVWMKICERGKRKW